MTRKRPQSAPDAPAKRTKHRVDTSMACAAENALEGLYSVPPDLREFLRNHTVTEVAELLRIGKGTASRIKRGIYPHAPTTLIRRWEALRVDGAVQVGTWALRRVMACAAVHEAVLWGGVLYSGAGLHGMRGRQIAVAPMADGGLLAQTMDLPAQRFALVALAAAADNGQ